MNTLRASVDRGGVNHPEDVRLVQELLNHSLPPLLSPLSVDGCVGEKTIEAIKTFQKEVVKLRHPDGFVSLDGRTFAALTSGNGKAGINEQ